MLICTNYPKKMKDLQKAWAKLWRRIGNTKWYSNSKKCKPQTGRQDRQRKGSNIVAYNFPANVSSLTFPPLTPLLITVFNRKPDSYFCTAAQWSRLQDSCHTGIMRCELCLILGKVLIFFIIQLNNNLFGPTKKYSIWRFYFDKYVNQKYKFTAPNQIFLSAPGEWFEFSIFFAFSLLLTNMSQPKNYVAKRNLWSLRRYQ